MDNTRTIKSYTLYNYKEIPQIANLSEEDIEAIEIVGLVLPFKTNNYVVEELINWDNVPDDPIFTLTFPRKEMLQKRYYNTLKRSVNKRVNRETLRAEIREIRLQLNPNPAGQEHNVPELDSVKLKGVQHKYTETVLFFPSQGQTCHAYCSFCFRWPQFSGMTGLKFAMKESELLFKYLKNCTKVTDILFTGGDPMTMTAKHLKLYLTPLLSEEFTHIKNIRIGTKSLSYWPYRYLTDSDSDEIITLFSEIVRAGKHLSIQAHFNHPTELSTSAVVEAINRIRSTGAQIRTQSPLLKHINDNAKIWTMMWKKQIELGCIPYYMFVARETGAQHFFELPLHKCWNIFRRAYREVTGLCRTVRGPSMSDTPGKIQIIGIQEINGEKVFVLEFIQARNKAWVGIPFFAAYNPNGTWFSQLKPAFGEEKFFFEKSIYTNKRPKPFAFE